jgi:RNA polymerase sigma-70 factor (ECF subfamily)
LTTHQVTSWNSFFTQVTQSHWDSIFRFLLSLTHQEADAEDLLQHTLLKALKGFPEFFKTNYQANELSLAVMLTQNDTSNNIPQHVHNWLMKIAKNSFLDSIQRSSRKLRHFPIEEWDESEHSHDLAESGHQRFSSMNHRSTSYEESEAEFFNHALDDNWIEKLSELSAKQRSILYLAAEEYSYKDISQILDIPMGTVMSSLSRTVSKLKKLAKEP